MLKKTNGNANGDRTMDVEWQMVKLPMSLSNQRLDSVIVTLSDNEEAMVPFFEIKLTENKELETPEEKFADYKKRFIEQLDAFKNSTYDCACERLGRPPKMAVVFISKDLTLYIDTSIDCVLGRETFAHAEIGLACFDEEVDLDQFRILE